MAAYAALVSLMHTIEQIQHHPRPPISLDKQQADSLTEKVTFLQHFLEDYSRINSKEVEQLESRIADAAHAAEDIIESYIVDQIDENISSNYFCYQCLQNVIEHMKKIKGKVEDINKWQKQDDPHSPISLDQKQVDSITENVAFLRRFLEDYSSGGSKKQQELESRIADAAYGAENVIESHIVDQIHAGSISHGEYIIFYIDFDCNECVQGVVQHMNNIRIEVMVLMEIIKQKRGTHPPISLDERQFDSITEDITFFQHFLEGCSSSGSKEDKQLESHIADTAYADIIESYIVNQINAGSTTSHGEKISPVDFYKGVQKVMQDMDLIKQDVMEVQDQPHRNSSISISSAIGPAPMVQNDIMVDFGDILTEVLDKLAGQPNDLQIIPIVGIGGIGKTTLARNLYAHPLTIQQFDILAWITISQEYSEQKILSQVLCQLYKKKSMDSLNYMSEATLGEYIYKYLSGRRYLIVMDDIWSTETWEKVMFFFPNNNNGSRIMITTRLSNLAFQLNGSHNFQMKFLDDDRSWNLLKKIVFGEEGCPIELQQIGKKIAKNCRGLPLSIILIGGVLTRFKVKQYWAYALENLNLFINLENDEHCLQILHTSYKELPIHLKPCFLYMGVFPKDVEIRVSELIKLWVSEGFLKPIDGKSLEIVAEEYLKELIDRNLIILVHKLGWNGEVAICKIHDRLRDLCLIETQKQKFLCILKQQQRNIPQGIDIERRICIHNDRLEAYSPQILPALESAPLTRSLLLMGGVGEHSPPFSSRLLRVYKKVDKRFNLARDSNSLEAILQQVNLRYLHIELGFRFSRFPASFSLLWNLQTLMVSEAYFFELFEIWKMPKLRHVMSTGRLGLPYPSNQEYLVLENLQTLSKVSNFKCGEEMVKRIPNIKKLKLYYQSLKVEDLPNYCLNNLGHLQKLESLELELSYTGNLDRDILRSHLVQSLIFPHSLKKLTLYGTKLHWEDLMTKIGSLPLLEVLNLSYNSCIGPEWETVEGQFCSLKFLLIACRDLKYWTTESTHFPLLEHLSLLCLPLLMEIPSGIGDIPTLRSIQLFDCRNSAANSAEEIKEEQEELGNEGLKVQIWNEEICVLQSAKLEEEEEETDFKAVISSLLDWSND